MPGMGGQDMATMAAYSAKVNTIAQVGRRGSGRDPHHPRHRHPRHQRRHDARDRGDLRPEGGDLYETIIEQSMLPFQMERHVRGPGRAP